MRGVCSLALVACLLVGSLSAATPSQAATTLSVEYRVEFKGTSTLHDFEGTAAAQTSKLESVRTPGEGNESWNAELTLPVAALDTDNRWRDEKMRAMFDAERYPMIRASFAHVDPASVRPMPSTAEPTLPFRLTIRDVTRDVTGIVTDWSESDTRASFDVRFHISLENFGLEPPSTLGLLNVGDRVDVVVHSVVSAPDR